MSQLKRQPEMILRGVSFPLDNAGTIRLTNDASVGVIGPMSARGDRLQFGAFDVHTPAGHTLEVSRMEYRRVERSYFDKILEKVNLQSNPTPAGAAVGAGALAAAPDDGDDEARLTRRQVLALGALSLGAAAGPAAVGAMNLDGPVDVVNIKVEENKGGAYFSLVDAVADVLPEESGEYVLTANGEQIDSFEPDDKWAVLPPGVTGEVSIITEADIGIWHRLRLLVSGKPALAFSQELPSSAASYAPGTILTVSTSKAIVRPLDKAGPGGAIVRLGDTSIPHEEETDDSAAKQGTYFVSNETTLAYTTGEEAPDSKTMDIEIRVDTIDEKKDDIVRGFH